MDVRPFFQRYGWIILLIVATALVFFFRFYQTTTIPPEPFSDHAEKILDVYDVSQGQTHIFFIRNTGREAFQMYWTLLISWIFRTGLSFLSLKLGTAILGFLTLPFIYLLGEEIGGRRVGLFAFIMAGIGVFFWESACMATVPFALCHWLFSLRLCCTGFMTNPKARAGIHSSGSCCLD